MLESASVQAPAQSEGQVKVREGLAELGSGAAGRGGGPGGEGRVGETVEGAPPIGIFSSGVRGARRGRAVALQMNLGAGGSQRDRLLLEINLRALFVGIGERAEQQNSHRQR